VKSALRLSLVAGVIGERTRDALATIASAGGRERRLLGVGDRIAGAELLGLERIDPGGGHGNAGELVAVLCNDGTREYVGWDPSIGAEGGAPHAPPPGAPPGALIAAGVRSVAPNRYDLDSRLLDGGDRQAGAEAEIVEATEDGVVSGGRVVAIAPGALLAALGVEPGDVIRRVNGAPVDAPGTVLELYQRLRETSHASIELDRDGEPVRLEYDVKGSEGGVAGGPG
jgi:general secretion pathway protein C